MKKLNRKTEVINMLWKNSVTLAFCNRNISAVTWTRMFKQHFANAIYCSGFLANFYFFAKVVFCSARGYTTPLMTLLVESEMQPNIHLYYKSQVPEETRTSLLGEVECF